MHQAVSAFRRALTSICLVVALLFIWRNSSAEPVADSSSASVASASGTTIPSATRIIDSSGNTWTVSDGAVYENGAMAARSANVKVLLYDDITIYQENTVGAWWSWNGSTWIPSADPRLSTSSTNVDLNSVDNVHGIADRGTAPVDGGVDTSSYAFAANLLGTTAIYAGSTFTFGAAPGPTAVAAATITLPAGKYSSLKMLATGMYAPTTDLLFTVTYTDGTTSEFTQSLSSWGAPEDYPGESKAVSSAYRVTPSGAIQGGPWYIYGYEFPLNNAKVVRSLKLPDTRQAVVFAVDLGGSPIRSSTGSVTVSWSTPKLNTNGTPLTDLAGYTVYYGTNATTLTETFQIPNPAATNCVIRNLLSASTYYFSIAAYSTKGKESARSSVASMEIAPGT